VLPSLRPLIAESMEALAWSKPGRLIHEQDQHRIALAGAQTLRWCDANDPDVDPCSATTDRIDELAGALDDVRAAILAWDTSTGRKRHAALRDEIAGILAKADI